METTAIPSTPFNIHEYVATFFLPDSTLDYFDIVWAEETVIDDFPVRNRKFILHVRRRRWLDADGHNVVLNVYQPTAEGTRLSEEFASFLKRNSLMTTPSLHAL